MSQEESTLLGSIPQNHHNVGIVADWFDEQGDERGEMLRILYELTDGRCLDNRPQMEERLRTMLDAGVQPPGPFREVDVGTETPMRFAWIPSGVFQMGSPESEEGRYEDEGPQHPVALTNGYWMGCHQVTQAQWQTVMGDNPSRFPGLARPVETVSWDDCQEFIKKFNELTGEEASLPTEAQWEYACRAGTTTPYHYGNTITKQQAQFSASETCDVGTFVPNGFGLYDMHGNVWEWCQDWYDGAYQVEDRELTPMEAEFMDEINRGRYRDYALLGRGVLAGK